MYNGMINVYKEQGYTSHDVVAKLRGILKQKKIGHTGTLDPLAEGVLPVCLGSGTKLCDMITNHDKEYEAVMLLGTATDTEDITGKVLSVKEVSVSEKDIADVIAGFTGVSMQVPPMYSAIRKNGRHLYELAREGQAVEREARRIEISDIQILSFDLPYVHMRVQCSKGTYIRSLCRDIGEKLLCGGCMSALKRTRVGVFDIRNAWKLKDLESLVKDGEIDRQIVPVDAVFAAYPAIAVDGRNAMLVSNGNPFCCENGPEGLVRVYLPEGVFAGIYRYQEAQHLYRPEKMFLS